MYRFFSPSQNISSNRIIIPDKEQIHHIKDVLHLKADDELIVFDEQGKEYTTGIGKILPQSVILKIKDTNKNILLKKTQVTIACAIPKKSKMDDIVDKLSQLGVDRIIPLITERVVVKLDNHKKMLRKSRWESIALNSAKQSQRNTIMMVESIKDIKEVLSRAQDFDLKLMPTLEGRRKSLKEILNESKPRNILVFIGPEGDFTPQEVELAKKAGCIPVSLGDLVLRVETAAVSVASFIGLYENN